MLTESELILIAENNVAKIGKSAKMELVLIREYKIEKPYGTVFFYTSKKYYETRDDKYAVAGNAPFLIENKRGKIVEFGTAETMEYYLEEYEANRWPNNRRFDF